MQINYFSCFQFSLPCILDIDIFTLILILIMIKNCQLNTVLMLILKNNDNNDDNNDNNNF